MHCHVTPAEAGTPCIERRQPAEKTGSHAIRWALAGTVLLLLTFLAGFLWMQSRADPAEFKAGLSAIALNVYAMDIETNDPAQIRAFLAGRRSIADYTVPRGLESDASLVGGMALAWEGKPVSMICYHSGAPLRSGSKSDLYLFVTENAALRKQVPSALSIARLANASTATWTQGDKIYFLVADGPEDFLRRFL